MKKDQSINNKVRNVGTTVSAIESLRKRLFYQQLPPLYAEHAARTVFCDGLIWVVVSADKDTIEKIDKVSVDNSAETGEHVKLFDELGEPMAVPKDIVVLYQSAGDYKNIVKDLIKEADDITQ